MTRQNIKLPSDLGWYFNHTWPRLRQVDYWCQTVWCTYISMIPWAQHPEPLRQHSEFGLKGLSLCKFSLVSPTPALEVWCECCLLKEASMILILKVQEQELFYFGPKHKRDMFTFSTCVFWSQSALRNPPTVDLLKVQRANAALIL